MKKLPIGISTLANILNEGYVYVDKTHGVQMLKILFPLAPAPFR